MRSKNDDQVSERQLTETTKESPPMRSKRTYSRELLLSFSGLDICKKLPDGFNSSILNDFECASNSVPERSRIPESLSSQNLRRGEYGSSPPIRGDSGVSSRGAHGRWDTRSSGSNDKDSDTQSNTESDSGWQYVTHSRRSWQKSEHDGLLGSGSFPKASGYTSGPVTNVRGSGQYQLKRSSEPYQPPRPYKAAPHSRNATDVINEETFGSSESSNLDREEEERKRRASFEQFRKEQKALQEKQKQFPEKHKENVDPDIAALMANSEDDKKLWDKNTREGDMTQNISHVDTAKGSLAAQISSSRPLVPPGFAGSLEKNLGTKSSNSHSAIKVGNGGMDENITRIGGFVVANGASDSPLEEKPSSLVNTSENKYENRTAQQPPTVISEKSAFLPLDGAVHENADGLLGPSYTKANLSDVYGGVQNDRSSDLYVENIPGHEDRGTSSQEHSTSILAKLFSSIAVGDTEVSGLSKPTGVTADIGSPSTFQSSKFTHWFLEEDNRPEDNVSSGKPEDLLSLIVNGDKDGSQVSRVSDKRLSLFTVKGNDLMNSVTTTSSVVATGDPYQSSNSGGSQAVLTCEDLEQSILSEFSDSSTNVDRSFQAWNILDAKSEKRPEVDNQASQHLLSLLQKGTGGKDVAQYPISESSENLDVYETHPGNDIHATLGDAEKGTKSENSLTLETLFGTAFMKELQSVKAPVSVQRGSAGGISQTDVLESQRFPYPVPDDRSTLEGDRLNTNHIQQRESNQKEAFQSHYSSNLSTSNVVDRTKDALDIQLPDEESLFTLSDPVIPQNSTVQPVGNASETDISSSLSMPVSIVDKLAALNAVLQKERPVIQGFDDPPFLPAHRNPPMESDFQYRNQFEQPTSPYAHLQQMNRGRPLYQSESHLSHMNPPPNVTGLENSLRHEYSQHQYPPNHNYPPSFQHLPNGPTRLTPAHHPMLQQMHMQGNALQSHSQRGLPRGVPMPQYGTNHMPGYAPEPHSMQSYPYGHQPNYGGRELPMQVGRGSHNHPEALEKLIEMELRANLRQMHPAAGGAARNNGNGIDMGFRYR